MNDQSTADPIPSAPGPEVLEAIGAATRTCDRLQAHGVQLRFQLDDRTGKVAVHLCDLQGTVVGSLTPSELLELATSGID